MEDADRCLLDDVRHLEEAELDGYFLAVEELDDHLAQCVQLVRSARLVQLVLMQQVSLAQLVLPQLVQALLLVREQVLLQEQGRVVA